MFRIPEKIDPFSSYLFYFIENRPVFCCELAATGIPLEFDTCISTHVYKLLDLNCIPYKLTRRPLIFMYKYRKFRR